MGHTAIPYNSSMWIYGGYNFVSTFDSVEVFSLAEKTWKIVDSKPWLLEYPVGRYLHSAVLFDGSQMMVYGGINARYARSFWIISLSQEVPVVATVKVKSMFQKVERRGGDFRRFDFYVIFCFCFGKKSGLILDAVG